MNLTHYDLDQLASGDVVEVALAGNAANVRLMDAPNFSNLRVRAGSSLPGSVSPSAHPFGYGWLTLNIGM